MGSITIKSLIGWIASKKPLYVKSNTFIISPFHHLQTVRNSMNIISIRCHGSEYQQMLLSLRSICKFSNAIVHHGWEKLHLAVWWRTFVIHGYSCHMRKQSKHPFNITKSYLQRPLQAHMKKIRSDSWDNYMNARG